MDYNNERLCDLVRSDNNIESVRNMLAKGKDPNFTDSNGDTLLHIAAQSIHDNPLIVQELINAGADVSKLDSTSSTALHFAVIRGKRKVVDVLLQTEIPINHKNNLGITALHYAINRNFNPIFNIHGHDTDMYIFRKLLDHRLININETDNYQLTALAWAININHFGIVKLLLNKNARIDTLDNFGNTPLHYALFNGDCNIVVALLLKQASLLKSDEDRLSALNNIVNSQTVEFAYNCLKVIAFKYNLELSLAKKVILNPELLKFLCKCWNEIENMKNDIIVNEMTVYDFFIKADTKHGFHNPILHIYKPVVKKILTGSYPVYRGYILNRMSNATLYAVLEVCINDKYDNDSCALEYFAKFLKIIQIRLLFKYLSKLEIFYLILAFTNKTGSEYLLDFYETEWHLAELWDVYPDDHFC